MKPLLGHRRMLALLTLVPWTAAALYSFLSAPSYVSEAKLLVRYVIDPDVLGPEQSAYLADTSSRVDPMVQAEMDVLASRELAEKVVGKVGLRRLAPKDGDPTDPSALIARGLTVSAEKGDRVIRIAFKHADAETAQATLKTLIDEYLSRHLAVHRTADAPGEPWQGFPKSLALITSSAGLGRSAAGSEMRSQRDSRSVPHVAVVQQPTTSRRDTNRRNKILLGLIAAGPVLGILGAFGLRAARHQKSTSQPSAPQQAPPA